MIINLGDAPFKAFITVAYPNGTCTVTDGNKTYTHTGGGTHTFIVKKKGTYTVSGKATDGMGGSEAQTVTITERGQTENVELVYRLHLFKEGQGAITPLRTGRESNATVKVGTNSIAVTASGSSGNYSLVETKEAIDLTNYSTIYLSIKCIDEVFASYVYAKTTPQAVDDDFSAPAKTGLTVSSSRVTKTVNVSSRTGMHYVGVHGAWEGDIYDWYIE